MSVVDKCHQLCIPTSFKFSWIKIASSKNFWAWVLANDWLILIYMNLFLLTIFQLPSLPRNFATKMWSMTQPALIMLTTLTSLSKVTPMTTGNRCKGTSTWKPSPTRSWYQSESSAGIARRSSRPVSCSNPWSSHFLLKQLIIGLHVLSIYTHYEACIACGFW